MENSQDKSRIYIISTAKALTLARVLSKQLATEFSEPIIWCEAIEGKCSHDVNETLAIATSACDFAVFVILGEDVVFKASDNSEARNALDNLLYETGLFLSILGSERCFLFSDLELEKLPVNFRGINYFPFHDPAHLNDPEQCDAVVHPACVEIKDDISEKGGRIRKETLPLLSISEVFAKERHERQGGHLQEGYVMVCDAEPFEDRELALQVKQNIAYGISYIYFFQATPENAREISSLLKVMLLTDKDGKPPPVHHENDVILENLKYILQSNSLNVYFMKTYPSFRFRIHNASDPEKARAYVRLDDDYFVEWREGVNSKSIWNYFLIFAGKCQQQSLFRSNMDFELYDKEENFLNNLKEEMSKEFPEISIEVINLCFQPEKKKNPQATEPM